MRGPTAVFVLGAALLGWACGPEDPSPAPADAPASAKAKPTTVGYDLRRLRPVDDVPLEQMFERLRSQALSDGKQVAVLFSADWCEPCQILELELGNMHPPDQIAHIRILELKEEDWQKVTRMNEMNALRLRWEPGTKNSYPIFVVLDQNGDKIEEMREAKERIEQGGGQATIPMWFAGLARS